MDPLCAVKEASETETRLERKDDHLVAAATNGDAASFEALVERNKRLVFSITRRMTRNVDDAEDLCQQAFMKAFANLSRFGGRCSFSTWLVSIATNEARMWYRKARSFREVPMTELSTSETFETTPLEFMDSRPSPEHLCLQAESSRLLLSAMENLPSGMREALKLCDIQELSTTTAAILLGISVNAVKSRRLRGRLALHRELESGLPSRKDRPRKGAHTQARQSSRRRDAEVACTPKIPAELPRPGRL